MLEKADGPPGDVAQAVRLTGAEGTRALVVFQIGASRYALPCDRVAEIIAAVSIQHLPNAPAIVEGAINVRGTIVPVLDIARRFGEDRLPLHPDQHFILARTGGRTVALHVERAHDVIGVDAAAIRTGAELPGTGLVEGFAPVDDGLLVIHDLDAFLAAHEAAELDAALAVAGTGAESLAQREPLD